VRFLVFLFGFFIATASAQPVVNIYAWGGEIPKSVLQHFEQETGIKVNFSTYDSNETMFAKLKASQHTVYDVILPSTYYVERMRHAGMLEPMAYKKLPNSIHITSFFRNNAYDPHNQYSIPLIWGTTGIFAQKHEVVPTPQRFSALWSKRWRNQLMLLDDSREVFAMALLSLGFSINDPDPEHIRQAYERLLALVPNIKLFASEGIQAILIDKDARLGIAWNGDVIKAQAENPDVQFMYPEEGFVIWIDCLAIPKNAPHKEEALQFINYLLRPEIAAELAKIEGHAITNEQGRNLLPEQVKNNPILYPNEDTLHRGEFHRDISDDALRLYNQYWEQFKLAL